MVFNFRNFDANYFSIECQVLSSGGYGMTDLKTKTELFEVGLSRRVMIDGIVHQNFLESSAVNCEEIGHCPHESTAVGLFRCCRCGESADGGDLNGKIPL